MDEDYVEQKEQEIEALKMNQDKFLAENERLAGECTKLITSRNHLDKFLSVIEKSLREGSSKDEFYRSVLNIYKRTKRWRGEHLVDISEKENE